MPKTIVFNGMDIHGMMDRIEKAHGLNRCSCGFLKPKEQVMCADCWDEVRSEEEANAQDAVDAYYN